MAVIVDIDHEGGDLSEYDSTVEDSGDLSAHADAALASTNYGLKCVIDDTTAIYGQKSVSLTGKSDFRCRFYIDVNSLTMGDYEIFDLLHLFTSGAPWRVFKIDLRWDTSNYKLRFIPYNDAGGLALDDGIVSNAEHYAELYIQRAASDVSSDGAVEWWIDGVSQGTWSGVDNYNSFLDASYLRFGALAGIDVGTDGTLYLDELKANDDGAEIGAVAAGATVPPIWHHLNKNIGR